MFRKTIRQLIKETADTVGFFDAEYLLAHALGKTREWVAAHPTKKIPALRRMLFHRAVGKRKSGVPAAHIVKRQEFYGLPFFVNNHVMVPRPATELMVDCALKTLAARENYPTLVLDIGTGSGCIPVAIAKSAKTLWPKHRISFVATDISNRALRVAKRNAKTHGVDIAFLHGNLLTPLLKNSSFIIPHSSFIITANLPYLTKDEIEKENPPRREPNVALLGGKDGLQLYEELLSQIQRLRQFFHGELTIFFEIHPEQVSRMKELVGEHLPDASIETHADLTGADRVVETRCVRLPQKRT